VGEERGDEGRGAALALGPRDVDDVECVQIFELWGRTKGREGKGQDCTITTLLRERSSQRCKVLHLWKHTGGKAKLLPSCEEWHLL
jgi:hypothetical protein